MGPLRQLTAWNNCDFQNECSVPEQLFQTVYLISDCSMNGCIIVIINYAVLSLLLKRFLLKNN